MSVWVHNVTDINSFSKPIASLEARYQMNAALMPARYSFVENGDELVKLVIVTGTLVVELPWRAIANTHGVGSRLSISGIHNISAWGMNQSSRM